MTLAQCSALHRSGASGAASSFFCLLAICIAQPSPRERSNKRSVSKILSSPRSVRKLLQTSSVQTKRVWWSVRLRMRLRSSGETDRQWHAKQAQLENQRQTDVTLETMCWIL